MFGNIKQAIKDLSINGIDFKLEKAKPGKRKPSRKKVSKFLPKEDRILLDSAGEVDDEYDY